MRTLNFLCGVAVLFTMLAYARLLHHHTVHGTHSGIHAGLVIAVIAGVTLGMLSLTGGFLLLKGSRGH